MKKGKMTEAEKQAWWAANKVKAAAKAERLAAKKRELDERNRRINDPNSESNRLLRKWHGSNYDKG